MPKVSRESAEILDAEPVEDRHDHEESHEAGDAFYAPPGHTLAVRAGTEFVQFSPTEELRKTESVMMKNIQGMQGA